MADRFASQTKPSPEVLRPELVIPGAARTGHFKKIRKASLSFPRAFARPVPAKAEMFTVSQKICGMMKYENSAFS